MKQTKFINATEQVLKRAGPILILGTMTLQILLTGCASINRKEETIDSILVRENVLIEKVKAERAQPEISQALASSEALKKAEGHLLMALDEIVRANEVVTRKLIKQNKEEVEIERSAASER